MQERVLLVYDKVAGHLYNGHRHRLKADSFREWRHVTRALRAGALADEMEILRSQYSETCSMLLRARQRVEALEVRCLGEDQRWGEGGGGAVCDGCANQLVTGRAVH